MSKINILKVFSEKRGQSLNNFKYVECRALKKIKLKKIKLKKINLKKN